MSIVEKFGTELDNTKLTTLCQISEAAERYDDMCAFVSKLVRNKCGAKEAIDDDTRNLLSVAFKNVVGAKRASWRTLSVPDQDLDEELLERYRKRVESECESKCNEILSLLNEHLIPNTKGNNDENEVFFNKMAGDYYRYLAEFSIKPDDNEETAQQNEHGQKAQAAYQQAMTIAKEHLNETDPTRLGLALNFSVCYYEILKKPEDACSMAKDAFDAAINKLDTLNDASYKDSTLIMQLLRDNLTLWTSNQEDDE